MRAHTTPRITTLSNLFAIYVGGSRSPTLRAQRKKQSFENKHTSQPVLTF